MSNPPPSERALVLAAARSIDERYMAIVDDFATELEQAQIFAALVPSDARATAAAVVASLTGSGHPAKTLREHSERVEIDRNRYINRYRVRNALDAAARLYKKRVYGQYRPPPTGGGTPGRPLSLPGG